MLVLTAPYWADPMYIGLMHSKLLTSSKQTPTPRGLVQRPVEQAWPDTSFVSLSWAIPDIETIPVEQEFSKAR